MERLTKLSSQTRTINPYTSAIGTGQGVWPRIIQRLAAYENTGLEPEEVEALKLYEMGKAIAEIKEFDGIPITRLRELAQAEKTGLLEMLPCKVGDKVYQTDGVRVYESKVKTIIFDAGHIAFDERAIGTSVFLTREGAEAALKGGAENA